MISHANIEQETIHSETKVFSIPCWVHRFSLFHFNITVHNIEFLWFSALTIRGI